MKKYNIYAYYDSKIVRVYQAFRPEIVQEAVKLGTFGSNFSLGRMSWIKPSFLWMMKRSGWATKNNQERVLQIDIYKDAFDELLKNSVLTNYTGTIYSTYELWREKLNNANVLCQLDPDKDIYGNNLDKSAIQLGLRGNELKKYVNEYIATVKDITEYVKEQKKNIDIGYECNLPYEKYYGNYIEIKKITRFRRPLQTYNIKKFYDYVQKNKLSKEETKDLVKLEINR